MQVSEDVLAVLSAAQCDGDALRLVGQLDRALYLKTNKVLSAAGGKWTRSAEAHLFPGDAATRVDQILLTGQVAVPKDEFDFFPTPPALVDRLLSAIDVQAGERGIEPSAGRAAIASAAASRGALMDCYELMDDNYAFLTGVPGLSKVIHADFLSVDPEPIYDFCAMNPPFTKQADIRHVMHATRFLKPGGRMGAIMAAGVLFRENRLTADFRAMVERYRGRVEELPDGAFKRSGTMVRTVMVRFTV